MVAWLDPYGKQKAMNQAEHIDDRWIQVERSHADLVKAVDAFLARAPGERVEALKANYGRNRRLVVMLLKEFVSVEDLKELLPFLLSNASSVHQYLFAFRQIILRIPREWLSARIEEAARPILDEGDDEDYRRILELCVEVEPAVARRIASRAVKSPDAEVRAVGAEFIEALS